MSGRGNVPYGMLKKKAMEDTIRVYAKMKTKLVSKSGQAVPA
jgi:hypothetical protein